MATIPEPRDPDDASRTSVTLAHSSVSPSEVSVVPEVAGESVSPQVSLSNDPTFRDFPTVSLPSPPSPTHSATTSDFQQDLTSNQPLIEYFQQVLSEYLTISIQGTDNPFREHILPLVYQHQGILHALLGLSACHMHISGRNESQRFVTISLQYQGLALHSLGALLLQEEVSGLTPLEEESKASMFFISALSWLDMLRGFSGAEKLAYDGDVRKCVRDHGSLSLHTLVGCPPIIFYRIGQVLESGKSYLAGDLSVEQFQEFLIEAEKFFRGWDPDLAIYPTGHQEWRYLAEAYRHACLLRVLRFPDAFAISCDDPRIKTSVRAIFDACAAIPRDTAFYKRLLFPLFLAGADTSSPHQMHYASWCIGEIKHATGFQHPAMTDVLTKVWEERRANPDSQANVPWMEFTCSEFLSPQHAYLFF
ncbi:Protein of unknown function DUF3468 [Penicillium occitanis (nom. inval.)]|nr:Protein of unknown function DUF3468 [Penicillium occitanis (nom. inval.)]PCG90700.1 hypothetical protein PENOC_100820 [Penicillium occitanis (nom. inval.)]